MSENLLDSRYGMASLVPDGTQHNSIVTNNSGYVKFATANEQSGATNWYSIRTTGNYGILINRPGGLFVSINQDIITSGSTGYTSIRLYKNGGVEYYQLVQSTNGQWDCMHIAGVFPVVANDYIEVLITGGTITGMDSSSWANYNFIWNSA